MAPFSSLSVSLLVVILGAFSFFGTRYRPISHLWRVWRALRVRVADLGFSPTQLTPVDVVFIFAVVISKSVLSRIGLLPALCPLPNNEGFALPEIRLSAPLHVSSTDRENYRQALATLQLTHDREAPSLLLASATTPLMLLTVAHYASPILPFGAVNTRNRFEFIDPRRCTQCQATLSANTKFGGPKQPGRRTKRGVEFDIIIEVYEPDSASTKSDGVSNIARSLIFRQVITVMQSLPKTTKPWYREEANTRNQASDPLVGEGVLTKPIHIPYRAPASWARVCRDYNPIHMSAVAGRMLGLPGRIVHGNHVAAAAVELISRTWGTIRVHPVAIDVVFRKPLVLPVDVELTAKEMGPERFHFLVSQDARPSVEGAFEMLMIEHTG